MKKLIVGIAGLMVLSGCGGAAGYRKGQYCYKNGTCYVWSYVYGFHRGWVAAQLEEARRIQADQGK